MQSGMVSAGVLLGRAAVHILGGAVKMMWGHSRNLIISRALELDRHFVFQWSNHWELYHGHALCMQTAIKAERDRWWRLLW